MRKESVLDGRTKAPRVRASIVPIVAGAILLSGCSLRQMAARTFADTLSESGDVFTRDDDPELVRDAIPFGLKTYETLLESVPRHVPLLVSTCQSFTQYAYAFVQTDAENLIEDDFEESRRQRERAVKLYLRGHGYCMKAMEVRYRGITPLLLRDPVASLAKTKKEDVPMLYWTAASWGAAMGLKPELAIDLPAVRALLERAIVLDEPWNAGALHEAMITVESLGEGFGGTPEGARTSFARAVELQNGQSPGPYVSLAMGVSVPAQDRAEFERLLNQALAIDPEASPSTRLVTILTQRRARALLDHADAHIPR